MIVKLMQAAILAAAVAVIVQTLPDIKRYWEIRGM